MDLEQFRNQRVFVSDYDGTITRHDFFTRILDRPATADGRRYWDEFLEGRLSHFDALRLIFGHVSGGKQELLEIAHETEIEPELGWWIGRLHEAGWKVLVVSAGCEWYIRQLFAEQQIELPIIANLGRLSSTERLEMLQPDPEQFYYSAEVGIDKRAIIEQVSHVARQVAFAGDGRPDLAAARLVPPELRFARDWLADSLDKEGLTYRPFQRWSEVARMLVDES